MNYTLIINRILILFILILVGYILRKKEHINEELNAGLTDLLMDVTLPALIITSMSVKINPNLISNIRLIVLLAVIIYPGCIVFIHFITKHLNMPRASKTVFKFLLVFANVGYMGYPVVDAIYPDLGIFYAIFINIIFVVLLWTYGIYLFTRDQAGNSFKLKQLVNNGSIATLIGLVLLFTGINLPLPLSGAMKLLGDMTFPLSMLIIGSSLANVSFKSIIKNKYLILLSLLKLIIFPLVLLLILSQFKNIPAIISTIVILLFGMPSGASSVIFAEKYNSDHEFAAEGVFTTTLLSLFTIPLIIWIIKLF